jgi:hypothetical protein
MGFELILFCFKFREIIPTIRSQKSLKIIEVTKILGYFFHGTSCVLILKKMGWARFWAIFSQADLRVPTFEFTYVVPRENI